PALRHARRDAGRNHRLEVAVVRGAVPIAVARRAGLEERATAGDAPTDGAVGILPAGIAAHPEGQTATVHAVLLLQAESTIKIVDTAAAGDEHLTARPTVHVPGTPCADRARKLRAALAECGALNAGLLSERRAGQPVQAVRIGAAAGTHRSRWLAHPLAR